MNVSKNCCFLNPFADVIYGWSLTYVEQTVKKTPEDQNDTHSFISENSMHIINIRESNLTKMCMRKTRKKIRGNRGRNFTRKVPIGK